MSVLKQANTGEKWQCILHESTVQIFSLLVLHTALALVFFSVDANMVAKQL